MGKVYTRGGTRPKPSETRKRKQYKGEKPKGNGN